MERLCLSLAGRALVVVDETYIEYAGVDSMAEALERLKILSCFARCRNPTPRRACGAASPSRADVTDLLRKVLAPYPIPQPVVQAVLSIMAPENQARLAEKRCEIVARRDAFAEVVKRPVQAVLPSDANYFLMIVEDADAL